MIAELSDTKSWLARAKDVFDGEIESMSLTKDSLGETFVKAVKIMLETLDRKGRIVITGVGKNLMIAEKISATMASTGSTSLLLNPVQAMHGDLGMLADEDCVMALSFSGESEEIVKLLPVIKRRGIKIIGLTGKADCSMARDCDVILTVSTPRECDPFNMAPTASTTATLAMGDALAMVLVDEQRFRIEDYAMNHPAGAIGRALVMKVSDIMRTGDALARVSAKATVMDAALAMTKSKSGSAIVVDRAGKLKGIFTDGDFRRVMAGDADSKGVPSPVSRLESPVSAYMTRSPQFVFSDAYAAELLKVFERKRIDDLPVCDRRGKVVGLVDIQDLPKMKVI